MAEVDKFGRISWSSAEVEEFVRLTEDVLPTENHPPLQRGASTSRRVPEPPPCLDWFEHGVMATDKPMLEVDREFLRALLRYVHRLERDVAEGSFW